MELSFVNKDVDLKIMEERSKEIELLADELDDLSEISLSLSYMLSSQGEFLDEVEKTLESVTDNVETGNDNLKKVFFEKKTFKNIAIVVGGTVLGGLGFLAGPVVGVATTFSGVLGSLGVVTLSK